MLKEISLVFAMHLHFRAFFLIPDATLKGYLTIVVFFCLFFFFQAEDGIRDHCVTGVQTCALPIFNKIEKTVLAKPQKNAALVSSPMESEAEVGFQPTPENHEIYVSRWRRRSESEIGRASCRERVEIAGGGGAGKDKEERVRGLRR